MLGQRLVLAVRSGRGLKEGSPPLRERALQPPLHFSARGLLETNTRNPILRLLAREYQPGGRRSHVACWQCMLGCGSTLQPETGAICLCSMKHLGKSAPWEVNDDVRTGSAFGSAQGRSSACRPPSALCVPKKRVQSQTDQ